MRVTLRLVLDCSADAAWEALRSPAGLQYTAGPFMTVRSLEPGGLPERWETDADHRVATALFGVVPAGEQRIHLHEEVRGRVRVLVDSGAPVTGMLALFTSWKHRMAVSPTADGRALYRDRLDVGGPAAVLAWPVLWAFWQWRAHRLRDMARMLPLV